MTAGLKVISPGLRTTVQDLGRIGFQNRGVPPSGALDPVNLRLANALVGNIGGEGALEIAYLGPLLEVQADRIRVALTGTTAGFDVTVEGETRRLPSFQSASIARGAQIRIGGFSDTTTAYLAIEGGLEITPVMGSLSTLLVAGLGGLRGRALQAGDVIALRTGNTPERNELKWSSPGFARPARFRVVLGPQDDLFKPEQIAAFLATTYRVGQASDRMGLRLEGPAIDHRLSIVSDGTPPGAIQVPGNGLPIILLADRGTTGGYPKIATVISADLPALGRLGPGAPIAFQAVSVAEAEAARRQLESAIQDIIASLGPVRVAGLIETERLHNANLISGVMDAGFDGT